jgi:REP element-mobilizing transposase RayT
MSRNYYSEILLHITWHTKESAPLLTDQIEPFVHRYLKQRLVNTPGVFVHEVGGTETHVHLAVSIVPTVLISDLIGQLKGASSHEANRQFPRQRVLEWQAGYGVVSFGTRALEWVREYVRNQKEHHARGTVHDRLERIVTADDGPPAGPEG